MVYTLKRLAAFSLDEFSAYSHASNFNLMVYDFLLRVPSLSSDIFAHCLGYNVTDSVIRIASPGLYWRPGLYYNRDPASIETIK